MPEKLCGDFSGDILQTTARKFAPSVSPKERKTTRIAVHGTSFVCNF